MATLPVLESRVTRLEALYDDIRAQVQEHDADLRQLRSWQDTMIGAAQATAKAIGNRAVIFGMVLTTMNIAVSLYLGRH